jgi:hypothetical protein
MVATYKIEMSQGKVRRKAGRPKGLKESGPRLPKGARSELLKMQRENARNVRMAALKRRQVYDSLSGEDLPMGASVNDLTPLQAQEMALSRQGMREQAQSLQDQLAVQRQQIMETKDVADRVEANRDQTEKLRRDTAKQAKSRDNVTTDILAELAQLRKDMAAGAASSGAAAGAASAMPSMPSTPVKAKARRGPARSATSTYASVASPPTAPAGMGGKGLLAGLQSAMDLAERGDPETAQRMIRSLQRKKLDPVSAALHYCKNC